MPECPSSADGAELFICWAVPVSNADSVNDYLVEVLEYFQPANRQGVETRPLTPAFQQEVQPLMTSVTSGVGESLRAGLWESHSLLTLPMQRSLCHIVCL